MSKYKAYSLKNFKRIPQLQGLPPENLHAIEVVGQVLPFRANNYVVEELIDWDQAPDDPVFRLTFPQPAMLRPQHFQRVDNLLANGAGRMEVEQVANPIMRKVYQGQGGAPGGDDEEDFGDDEL